MTTPAEFAKSDPLVLLVTNLSANLTNTIVLAISLTLLVAGVNRTDQIIRSHGMNRSARVELGKSFNKLFSILVCNAAAQTQTLMR